MLKLKSIKIQNLKSFHNNNEISGFNKLNILIGKNNQGKSNFLTAIKILEQQYLDRFLNEIPENEDIEIKSGVIAQHNTGLSIFNNKSRMSIPDARAHV